MAVQGGQAPRRLLSVALGDFGLIWRPERLRVGSVDLVFVVVEEDERPLRLWRRARWHVRLHLLGHQRPNRRDRGSCEGAAEERPPCYPRIAR